MTMRVRFAPSPTGQLHVGNVRTALFNWLLARGSGGTFILRIEDTDVERSSIESERAILEDLRWLGLDWDEGPDAGGDYGPYRQSERLERYQDAASGLLSRGLAYHCFCTPEELAAEREEALRAGRPPQYSGRCRMLPSAEAARRVESGEPAALRFRIPDESRDITFHDVVRGPVTINTDVMGDPIIVRSGGGPAYNFAVVIDDSDMAITHVVRGEDHLSNTPRQILMYEALARVPPVFAHVSMVLGPDHAPLSKRHGATSVAEFRESGVLPEALVNYLALLGWSPGDGEEIVPLAEMARRFDLAGVGHSAAVFDTAKLYWINRRYMKEAETQRLAREALPYFTRAGFVVDPSAAARQYVETLLPMMVGSVDRLDEMPARVSFIFDWSVADAAALVQQEVAAPAVMTAFAEVLDQAGPLTRETFRAAAAAVRERTGLKGKALFHPLRVAMTAADSGPELDLALPAIDRGAALGSSSGLPPIRSCRERASEVAALLTTGKLN